MVIAEGTLKNTETRGTLSRTNLKITGPARLLQGLGFRGTWNQVPARLGVSPARNSVRWRYFLCQAHIEPQLPRRPFRKKTTSCPRQKTTCLTASAWYAFALSPARGGAFLSREGTLQEKIGPPTSGPILFQNIWFGTLEICLSRYCRTAT